MHMDKITDWNNEPTLLDLKNDYLAAQSDQSPFIAMIDDWKDAIDVQGRYKLPKRKRASQSSVQPKVIRKYGEWRYPSLTEPFLSVDNLFTATPRTPADTPKVNQDMSILNYQFNNEINLVSFIDKLVRTLCTQGIAIIRSGWAYETTTVSHKAPKYTYTEATPEQEQQILEASAIVSQDSLGVDALSGSLKESYEASVSAGRPIWATQDGYIDVDSEIAIKDHPTVEVCNYQNIVVDPTCGGDFESAKFVVCSFESSRADLEETGLYTNIDLITDSASTEFHGNQEVSSFSFSDKARKQITVHEYWGYWDIHGNGTTEAIVASWVGDVLIRLELNPYPHKKMPFVCIPYLPELDTIYGKSDPYLLIDTQKIIGALTRGQLDTIARNASGQRGIRKDAIDAANLHKFQNGDDYVFNKGSHPSEAIYSHMYTDLPASSFALLQMHASEAESITGISSFGEGINGDQLGTTATGVNGVLSLQSRRELSIIRRISQGLITLARMVLAMNELWLPDEKIIQITNTAPIRNIKPFAYNSYDMRLTVSNDQLDAIKANELSFMYQTVGNTLPFDLSKYLLAEIMTLRKLPTLAKRILEYTPEPTLSSQLDDEIKQLTLQKVQLEITKLQADIEVAQAQAAKLVSEARVSEQKASKLSIESQNLVDGTDHKNKLELIQSQAESNLNRDLVLKLNNLNEISEPTTTNVSEENT